MADSRGVKAVTKHRRSGKFLLMKRADWKEEHPGFWEFPGGGLKSEEDPREGCLRELKEETGLEGEIVKGGGNFTWYSEFTEREIESYSFLVEVEEEEIETSREHNEYEWLELEEIFNKKHFPLIEKDLENAGVEIEK